MSHFFLIEEEHISGIQRLFQDKLDGEYFVLARSGRFTDIAQYVDKFADVKIITVPADKLDRSRELK